MSIRTAPHRMATLGTSLGLIFLCTEAWAATVTVGPSGRDFTTIQAAVDSAMAGDRIEIDAGSYSEEVAIDKDLTVVGAGSDATLLSSDGLPLSLSEALVQVTGLGITAGGERGILISGGGVDFDDLTVTGASSSTLDGTGIYIAAGEVSVKNSSFDENRALGNNGGHIAIYSGVLLVEDSDFTGGRAQRGGAIYAYNSQTTIRRSSFSGNSVREDTVSGRGGAVRVELGIATIEESSFDDNLADSGFGGHFSVYTGRAVISDSTFTNGTATDYFGGALALFDSDTEISGSSFEDNRVDQVSTTDLGHGGALFATGDPTQLTVTDSTFLRNSAGGYGGALRIEGGDAVFTNATIEANSASYGGGLHVATSGVFSLVDTTLRFNEANHGGGIRWRPVDGTGTLQLEGVECSEHSITGLGSCLYGRSGDSLSIDHSQFSDNESSVGGALMLWAVATVDVHHSLFCGNSATTSTNSDGGASATYLSGLIGGVHYANNVFLENTAGVNGGAISFLSDGDATVLNNHFIANASTTELGAAVGYRDTDSIEFVNNLVAWTDTGGAISGDLFESASILYNDFYEVYPQPLVGALSTETVDETNISVEPGLAGESGPWECALAGFIPTVDSLLQDAGDPERFDPNGSRSDIGALGGDQADEALWMDLDEDGWPAMWDCNDTDSQSFPGNEEIPYDGVDQDCDGNDLTDVDGDGFDGGDGDDCDDNDPEVFPGAEDAFYDGVDQDCDGSDDFDQDGDGYPLSEDCDDEDMQVNPGMSDPAGDGIDQDCDGQDGAPEPTDEASCRCQSGGVSPWGMWGGAFLLLFLGRRRMSRRSVYT